MTDDRASGNMKPAGSQAGRAAAVMTAIAVALVACGLAVAVFPAPGFVVRHIVRANATWMVRNPADSADAAPLSVRQRLLAAYVQYGLAAALNARDGESRDRDEVALIARRLLLLRHAMLNQAELAHHPVPWMALVSGIGYCDQMNAMAATALARSHGRAQLVALSDSTFGGHTVGRVWSASRGEWVYFDLWADIVVFRFDSAGALQLLSDTNPFPGPLDDGVEGRRTLYASAPGGEVFNEYPSTFLGYAWRKATTRPANAATSTVTSSAVGGPAPSRVRVHAAPDEARRLYAEARVSHVLGHRERARREYAGAAEAAPGSFVADAAQIFERRLRSP